MQDLDPRFLTKVNEKFQLDQLFGQKVTAEEMVEKIKANYPNAYAFFLQNMDDAFNTLRGKLGKDDIDELFSFMANNFILIMHLLDVTNNGEEIDEDIPDESENPDTIPCEFGHLNPKLECENNADMTITIGDASVNLCQDCAQDVMKVLIEGDGIMEFVTSMPLEVLEAMLDNFLVDCPKLSQERLVQEIYDGKVSAYD